MKEWLFVSAVIMLVYPAFSQEIPATMEQQLEDITEMMEDAEVDDDSWWQTAEALISNPINLNTAGERELKMLQQLSPIQIDQFLRYRKIFGPLLSIYELQAVPDWDLQTIERIMPFVTVKSAERIKDNFTDRFSKGSHQVISRYSTLLKRSAGYASPDSGRSHYTGDPSRIMLRYRYQFKNTMQYGITAAKDAGEPFFAKPNNYGFDSYSFHYFSRHSGFVKTVALGDYTINIGQGLILWQSLAFGKGNAVMNVKRQANILRPYNSAGYYYFNRGAATTLQKNNWETTLFLSHRFLDGNIETDENGTEMVTSIKTSGYRRTPSEIDDKHSMQQVSYGATLHYKKPGLQIGVNTVQYQFSKLILREQRLYNLYAISGSSWSNYSFDYSYTYKNVHLSGETAVDKNGGFATINSLLANLHHKVDFVMLYRSVSKTYQAIAGNAFTVSRNPSNERGIYTGVSIKPRHGVTINAYVDLYSFPWLRYRIDAPSQGRDYFVQVNYKPNKITEMYSRFRSRMHPLNHPEQGNALYDVMPFAHRSWRTQFNQRLNKDFSIRHRFEMLWYQHAAVKEQGFLAFFDLFYKPMGKPFSLNGRIQHFDSDSYNSRMYAYENDVLYYYAVPVFYDKGSRYYINLQYKFAKGLSCWVKFGQTVYHNRTSIGSGLDKIEGNRRPELRMLASLKF